MVLVEWYYDPGTLSFPSTTILGVTAWKARFISGVAVATGSSTTTTTTFIEFPNALKTIAHSQISATTTSTSTSASAQQYPAGEGNSYFSPLIGNTLEMIVIGINNSASIDGNFVAFAVEIDLEGEFDE